VIFTGVLVGAVVVTVCVGVDDGVGEELVCAGRGDVVSGGLAGGTG
jgi:hypothetical protein